MKTDMDKLAEIVHEAYNAIDEIAFRQQTAAGDDGYLVFTEFVIKIKSGGLLYSVKVDSEMQRVVIEQLDESEEVPF